LALNGTVGNRWSEGELASTLPSRGYQLAYPCNKAVLGLKFRLPELTTLNLDPLNRWIKPDIAVDIRPRSGPIVITIEYVIRPQDVVAFLSVMAERRRIRRRDGARHWTLLRDLEDPAVWVERYHSPTWVEYVRHNLRMTHADAGISERLQTLHQGPGQPRVHRMIERQTGGLIADDTSPTSNVADL
jgi:hypothetical protein